MAHSRKPASSRPKAKKATRTTKAAQKPTAKARPHKPAPAKSKVAAKAAHKPSARMAAGAKPAPPLKAGAKGAIRPKVKAARPPAVVHPIGVLPPEAISRAPQKPARPLPLPPRPQKAARPPAPDAGSQPVTAKDFPEFQQRLLEERVRVLKEMGHYESTVLKVNQRDSAGDLSGYSFHMADVGTDAMEREKAFQLASAEGRILLELNEALRRIARGEYGVCESCENPILRARLEAMPVARLCLACKEKEERAARGIS
jgi:RNA polymerase-binding transcription factor